MNDPDLAALAALSEKLDALIKAQSALDYLGKPETAKALADVVEMTPTLKALADGYRAAGVAGNFIKWIAGIATAVVALWALVRTFIFAYGGK